MLSALDEHVGMLDSTIWHRRQRPCRRQALRGPTYCSDCQAMGFKEFQALLRPIPWAGHLAFLTLLDLLRIWCCECKHLRTFMPWSASILGYYQLS